MKMRPKKSWLFFTIVILIVIAVLAVAMLSFPMHPSPEYSVNTYEDLSEEIKGLCSLPSKEVLPNIEVKYTVYLESRFCVLVLRRGVILIIRSVSVCGESFGRLSVIVSVQFVLLLD